MFGLADAIRRHGVDVHRLGEFSGALGGRFFVSAELGLGAPGGVRDHGIPENVREWHGATVTDKATLQKLFDAAMRGNADFTGKPLRRAFPAPVLNSESKPHPHSAHPHSGNASQPARAKR